MTGAGGSIGRACVLQFAHHGRTRIAGLAATATALSCLPAATAVEFFPLTVDQASEADVDRADRDTVARFGRIDYAVNNTAIAAPFRPTGASLTQDSDRVAGRSTCAVCGSASAPCCASWRRRTRCAPRPRPRPRPMGPEGEEEETVTTGDGAAGPSSRCARSSASWPCPRTACTSSRSTASSASSRRTRSTTAEGASGSAPCAPASSTRPS